LDAFGIFYIFLNDLAVYFSKNRVKCLYPTSIYGVLL